MQLVRTILVTALAAAGLNAPVWAGLPGEVITEPKFGFQIWIPMAWKYGTIPDLPFTHIAAQSPDFAASGANCLVGAEDIAITKGATQAQLNESLKVPVGREFWKSQVFRVLENVAFESDGARLHPTGIMIQEAIGSGDVTVSGTKASRTIAATLWITPGVTYTLVCSSYKARFEDFRTVFREAAETFRTKDTASVISASANPAPGQAPIPVVLMHGSAGFGFAPLAIGAQSVETKIDLKK